MCLPPRKSASRPERCSGKARFWGAIFAFLADAIVSVAVTLFTRPKPVEELDGLVWGMAKVDEKVPPEDRVWWRNPYLLGFGALAIGLVLCIIFF